MRVWKGYIIGLWIGLGCLGTVYAQTPAAFLNEGLMQPEYRWQPMEAQTEVTATGDLAIEIPLIEKLMGGHRLSLSYTSSIGVFQSSGWLGLGWHLDVGSITREVAGVNATREQCERHGSCEGTYADYTDVVSAQPDRYLVTLFGRRFSFIRSNEDAWYGQFVHNDASAWRIDPLGQDVISVEGTTATGRYTLRTCERQTMRACEDREDYIGFVITDDMGVRYVFSSPTIASFVADEQQMGRHLVQQHVNTWRLTAILDPLYGGGLVDPDPSQPGVTVIQYDTPIVMSRQTDGHEVFGQVQYPSEMVSRTGRVEFEYRPADPDGSTHFAWTTLGSTAPAERRLSALVSSALDGDEWARIDSIAFVSTRMTRAVDPRRRRQLSEVRWYSGDGTKRQHLRLAYVMKNVPGHCERNLDDCADDFGYLDLDPGYTTDATLNEANNWNLKEIRWHHGEVVRIAYESDAIDPSGQTIVFQDINGEIQSSFRRRQRSYRYGIRERTARQGGVRVTSITRTATDTVMVSPRTTVYRYGRGRLSGIPDRAVRRMFAFEGARFMRASVQARSAIYYTSITRHLPTGEQQTTCYLTDVVCAVGAGVSRAQHTVPVSTTLSVRTNGNSAIISSHALPMWGRAFYSDVRAGTRTRQESHVFTLTPQFRAVLWKDPGGGLSLSMAHRMLLPAESHTEVSEGDLVHRSVRRTTYDRHVGLPTTVEQWSSSGTSVFETITYASRACPSMADRHILRPVVRQATYQGRGGPVLAAEQVGWRRRGGGFVEDRRYIWRTDDPLATVPEMAGDDWCIQSGPPQGSGWVASARTTQWDELHRPTVGHTEGLLVERRYASQGSYPVSYATGHSLSQILDEGFQAREQRGSWLEHTRRYWTAEHGWLRPTQGAALLVAAKPLPASYVQTIYLKPGQSGVFTIYLEATQYWRLGAAAGGLQLRLDSNGEISVAEGNGRYFRTLASTVVHAPEIVLRVMRTARTLTIYANDQVVIEADQVLRRGGSRFILQSPNPSWKLGHVRWVNPDIEVISSGIASTHDRPAYVIDPRGVMTRYTYDTNGDLASVVNLAGQGVRYQHAFDSTAGLVHVDAWTRPRLDASQRVSFDTCTEACPIGWLGYGWTPSETSPPERLIVTSGAGGTTVMGWIKPETRSYGVVASNGHHSIELKRTSTGASVWLLRSPEGVVQARTRPRDGWNHMALTQSGGQLTWVVNGATESVSSATVPMEGAWVIGDDASDGGLSGVWDEWETFEIAVDPEDIQAVTHSAVDRTYRSALGDELGRVRISLESSIHESLAWLDEAGRVSHVWNSFQSEHPISPRGSVEAAVGRELTGRGQPETMASFWRRQFDYERNNPLVHEITLPERSGSVVQQVSERLIQEGRFVFFGRHVQGAGKDEITLADERGGQVGFIDLRNHERIVARTYLDGLGRPIRWERGGRVVGCQRYAPGFGVRYQGTTVHIDRHAPAGLACDRPLSPTHHDRAFGYDQRGNQVVVAEGSEGRVRAVRLKQYDSYGRQIAERSVDSAERIDQLVEMALEPDQAWDRTWEMQLGRVVTKSFPNGRYTYHYDAMDRISILGIEAVGLEDRSLRYGFDRSGRVSEERYRIGPTEQWHVSRKFDAHGRTVLEAGQHQQETWSATSRWYAEGIVARRDIGPGYFWTNAVRFDGRVTRRMLQLRGQELFDHQWYSEREDGLVEEERESLAPHWSRQFGLPWRMTTERHEWDAYGRLQATSSQTAYLDQRRSPSLLRVSHSYDVDHRRVRSMSEGASSTVTWEARRNAVGQLDELLRSDEATLEHRWDARGRLASTSDLMMHAAVYDIDDQLRSVQTLGRGRRVRLQYTTGLQGNVHDERRVETDGTNRVWIRDDEGRVLEIVDRQGGVARTQWLVPSGDVHIFIPTRGSRSVLHVLRDAWGSVRGYASQDGALRAFQSFSPWGEQLHARTLEGPIPLWLGYRGYERDLIVDVWRAGQRRYDAARGQWLAPDRQAGAWLKGDVYQYAYGNPIMFVDPAGEDTTVYFFDQSDAPASKRVYTASVYIYVDDDPENAYVLGPFRGSTYPNSSTEHRRVVEGPFDYTTQYGHAGGRTRGLNLVNDRGERSVNGIDAEGNGVTLTFINVHSGVAPASNHGRHNRGSAGCLTIHPDDASGFFEIFGGTRANMIASPTRGQLHVYRGASDDAKDLLDQLAALTRQR